MSRASRIRPAVPRADGQARCRYDRRAVAGDLDRSEVSQPQSASTVGTITEIYDYLRLLFARIGIPHDPDDGTRFTVSRRNRSSIASWSCPTAPASRSCHRSCAAARATTTRCSPISPVKGYVRARVDGEVVDIAEFLKRDDPGALREAHDQGRGRSSRPPRRHRAPADRVDGDGAVVGRRRRRDRDRQPKMAKRPRTSFPPALGRPSDGK